MSHCRLRLGRRLCCVLLASGGLCLWPPGRLCAQGAGRPVTVAPVREQQVPGDQSFVATVMPLRRSVVGSAVDGRVEEVHFDEGQRVSAGQPLARLRTVTLEIELKAAQAELELRKQELAELENGTRPEEIAQAKARMDARKALMEFTKARLERTKALAARNVASQDQLDDAVQAAEGALQAFVEARTAWELAQAGPREEQKAQKRALVAAQQEVINGILDRLDKHTIVAPFDGYVVAEHTEVGQWIKQGDPVAEVVDVAQVYVQAAVPESYLSALELDMPAEVACDALAGKVFQGTVAAIVPQADVRARSFPVKVLLQNEPAGGSVLLKPGMLARVTLRVGPRRASTLVPKDALVLGGPQPLVWQVERAGREATTGKARPLPVELGRPFEDLIEVRPLDGQRAALRAGDEVIVTGNERLRLEPQARHVDVTIVGSAAAAGAGAPAEQAGLRAPRPAPAPPRPRRRAAWDSSNRSSTIPSRSPWA